MKKPKEFDFEKSYNEFMVLAKDKGYENDMRFQSLMQEYRRIKLMSNNLYQEIELRGVSYLEVGSKGQETLKANPLNKDYINACKTLVVIHDKIGTFLDNIPTSNDDWV